jgi:hypothetical protein
VSHQPPSLARGLGHPWHRQAAPSPEQRTACIRNNIMSCSHIDKNLQYTTGKHSDTYSANFFIDNTFLLSTRGTSPVSRALVAAGTPVEGGVCPGEATAMVTLKLRSAGGGDRSGAASAISIDGSTASVGTPYPLAESFPISSSTVPLVRLGVGELPTRVKKKGEFQ